jgi:hypothetical protein
MKINKVLIGILLVAFLISLVPTLQSSPVLKEAPQRYFPFDGERNISITPTLVWLTQEGIDYYKVWIEDTGFSEISYGSFVSVPKDYLLEGNHYRWRIQGFTKEGYASPVSSAWFFRTQAIRKDLPDEPILISPYYNQMDVSLFAEFTWIDGNRASGFILLVRKADESHETVWNSGIIQGNSILVPYGVLENNTRYAWSMISVNERGYSPESSPLFFYTKE